MFRTHLDRRKGDIMKASDFYYCPTCNMERAPQSLIKEKYTQPIDICINELTGGYLEEYKYKRITRKIYNFKCPKCNNILKIITFDYE